METLAAVPQARRRRRKLLPLYAENPFFERTRARRHLSAVTGTFESFHCIGWRGLMLRGPVYRLAAHFPRTRTSALALVSVAEREHEVDRGMQWRGVRNIGGHFEGEFPGSVRESPDKIDNSFNARESCAMPGEAIARPAILRALLYRSIAKPLSRMQSASISPARDMPIVPTRNFRFSSQRISQDRPHLPMCRVRIERRLPCLC
jgi:hypothetical protein